ncbi:MAG: lysine--tRNA ligase [Ignisphaera sp.]
MTIEKHRFWKFIDLGIDPYISEYRYDVDIDVRTLKKIYSNLNNGDIASDRYSIAGRLMGIRRHGKIVFGVLDDSTDTIQLVFRYDVLGEDLWKVVELINVGDVIGVKGKPMRTLRGEFSLLVEEMRILSIAWREYPEKWHGLVDPDKRYRMRYLDIMLNPTSRKAIIVTHRIEKSFRDFLDARGFIEVHTPKLQPIYGGALARPFITKIYALDRTVYLSIAPETYLKRCVIGNLFKVYEISVCFRNEDIDAQHYPEFIQIEIYQAFADWNDMMKLVEEMISNAVKEVFGDYVIEIEKNGEKIELNFKPPWTRIKLEDSIEIYGGIKVKDRSTEELLDIAKSLEINIEDTRRGKIIEKIFEKIVEPKLIQPTYITLYPRDISPLARPYREDPRYAERFEIFINGLEIGNGYSELNNPIVQYYFFKKEEELRSRYVVKLGKEVEYHPLDKDYIRALEYAMPPTAGVGIGIYRLVMVVLGLQSIKDVIPFTIIEQDEFLTVAEKNNDIVDYYIEKLQLDKY